MFLDETTIEVISGKGGNGMSSFRREKYVPKGGPDGGDGGDGGSVRLRVNIQYTTLLDMGNMRKRRAEDGVNGGTARCTGRRGEDYFVDVPCGTIVRDSEGRLLADLTQEGQTWLAVRGGKGGKGNARFSSPSNQAPRHCTPGQPGESMILHLELKLMADVGLVGFPNAGKSSLVNKISSARPKVADYPFTTLEPILGIVQAGGNRSYVIADIPGIIEGAAEGKGLGHTFLKHIERTAVLLFMVDGFKGKALEEFRILRSELERFHPVMAEKPYMLAVNKCDLGIDEAIAELKGAGLDPMVISAVTGEGCDKLVQALADRVKPRLLGAW